MSAPTPALREALNQGISSGNFVDTKIILFSHRDSSGRVCRPKALYANSHVLKTVPYFDDRESAATLDTTRIVPQDNVFEVLSGNFAESRSKDFKEPIDDEESGEDYGYLSDSDLEDDEDEKIALFKPTIKSKVQLFDPFGVPGEDKKTLHEEHDDYAEKGKVIKIPDMAFVTFQAFLMYLYTKAIGFAPFGSEENRRSRSAEIVTPSDDRIPQPSPKSIYRLADKYDIPALKTLALDHIRGALAKCDIVEETFSRFASQYDEVRNLYVNQLASDWMEDSTMETTRLSVDEKIDIFAQGDLEHATEILSALWEIVNKDGDIKAPSSIPPATPSHQKKKKPGPPSAVVQVISPARWASLKIALIKSIRRGTLFDRKYWARHSKTGDVMKPVYFSSIVMSDKVQELKTLVKYLKGQNVLINGPEGDTYVNSDCECDSTGASASSFKEEWNEEETRAVLVAGPFLAWKSLFFYLCTDMISFAPLKSQAIGSRVRKINTLPAPSKPRSVNSRTKNISPSPTPPEFQGIESHPSVIDSLPTLQQQPKSVASPTTNPGGWSTYLESHGSSPAWGRAWGVPVAASPTLPESQGIESPPSGIGSPPTLKQQPKSVASPTINPGGWFTSFESHGSSPAWGRVGKTPVAASPLPCSPKSMYVLANLLGIQPLRDRAFADIKNKVSSDNVVDEVFSWVTASQEKIMEMECGLLISKFKDPNTIALVKENIGRISDGSSSYCAGALKLGLKKAFELKRQQRGVLLRCTRNGCTRNTTPASYSSAGSETYCQECRNGYGNYYMQCTGCSNTRISNYASCQSCGKKFM